MIPQTTRFVSGPLLPLSLLALALIISAGLFIFFRPAGEGRVFFYPDNSGSRILAERRSVPSAKDQESRIQVFLEELFLGPVNLKYSPAVPAGTVVRHVAVLDKTVYVDLGNAILRANKDLAVTFDSALQNLESNIFRNFPRVEKVVFTVEGSQVNAPFYSGDSESE